MNQDQIDKVKELVREEVQEIQRKLGTERPQPFTVQFQNAGAHPNQIGGPQR